MHYCIILYISCDINIGTTAIMYIVGVYHFPHRFNPDRFAPETSHARRGLEFCPFGTPSRRICPGNVFSHFEITIFVSILIHRFQVVPIPDQVVEREYGLVITPKNELFISVKER